MVNPLAAQQYLDTFDQRVQSRGEGCFREGRVSSLRCDEPGRSYEAKVEESATRFVQLIYADPAGWSAQCSCPVRIRCEHAYAATKALLAEHPVASVRALSGALGLTKSAVAVPGRPGPPPSAPPPPFAESVAQKLGRPLDRQEQQFLQRLGRLFERWRACRVLTSADFVRLGLPLNRPDWEYIGDWPVVPKTEHEFWLWMAYTAQESGAPIPEFLQPVTELNTLEERVREWRRAAEVRHWQDVLGQHSLPLEDNHRVKAGPLDLRLVLDQTGVRPAWKWPGQEKFEFLKISQRRQLAEDCGQGWIELVAEAALLWGLCEQGTSLTDTGRLDWFEESDQIALRRVLVAIPLRSLNSIVGSSEMVTTAPE